MKNNNQFNSRHFQHLDELYANYLSQRLFDPVPHLTFKIFLVSKNQRSLCDLLDAINQGKITPPEWFRLRGKTYSFSTHLCNNLDVSRGRIYPIN